VSDIPKVTIGTRRRLLSSDFNNGQRLRDRALLETLGAIGLGDLYKITADGVGGVVGGLTVRAVVGTNEIEVQPGIAFVAETPASATYDAPVNWIELGVPTRLDLDSFVDGGNPRLVTIEIEPNLVDKVTNLVDVFLPPTGTFQLQNQAIVIGSEPIISANAGAAGPNPVVAAGPGVNGKIPLAVVKLVTAQASFTDPFVSVLLCRPMLFSAGDWATSGGSVHGGGISVGERLGATIEVTFIAEMHDARVEMLGLGSRIAGQISFLGGTPIARTPDTTDPASLIGSAQAVYAYAANPPWAADYGTIAPREARVDNQNNIDFVSDASSVVIGDGFTFRSLALTNQAVPEIGPGSENAIVIWDTVSPAGISNGPLGAVPPRLDNLRGPHPLTDAGGVITLDATQDPSWGATQEVSDTVYLGCVSSLGILPQRFMAQSYRGRGFVRAIDEVDWAGTSYRPAVQYVGDTGVLDPLYPGRYPAMGGGDTEVIPVFATRVEVSGELSVGAGPGAARLQLASEYGMGAPQPSPSLAGFFSLRYEASDLPASGFSAEVIAVERDLTGRVGVYAQVGGGGLAEFTLTGYEDVILASR